VIPDPPDWIGLQSDCKKGAKKYLFRAFLKNAKSKKKTIKNEKKTRKK